MILRRKPGLVASLIMVLVLFNNICAIGEKYDPAPLHIVFTLSLRYILSGDYDKALELLMVLSEVNPPGLYSDHRRVIYALINVAESLRASGNLWGPSVKPIYESLYFARLELIDRAYRYNERLYGLYPRESLDLGSKLYSDASNLLEALIAKIDDTLVLLEYRYYNKPLSSNQEPQVPILIQVYPRDVLAGSNITVTIKYVNASRVTVTLRWLGAILTLNEAEPIGEGVFTATIRIPDAPSLEQIGVIKPNFEGSIRLLVAPVVLADNLSIMGLSYVNVIVSKPKVSINTRIENHTAILSLKLLEPEDVNASIIVDGSIYRNISLNRDVEHTISIPLGETRASRNLQILVKSTRHYSSLLLNIQLIPDARIAVDTPRFILVPPLIETSLNIKIRVLGPQANYTLRIQHPDGTLGVPYTGSSISLDLDMKSPLVLGIYKVRVELLYANYTLGSPQVFVTIVVPYTTLGAILMLVFLVSAYFIEPIPGHRFTRALIARALSIFKPRMGEEKEYKPKLYSLYIKVISVLERLGVTPPSLSETLREFLYRALPHIPSAIRHHISTFINLYELELYSNRRVNVREAERIVKEISRRK
ncbi:MAG: DUF4129 domain-containing protein [Acidilobaceae archaeon]